MVSGLPAFVLRYVMSRTWVSVLSLCGVVAVSAATYAYLADPRGGSCTVWDIRQGGNIVVAIALVGFSGIAAAVGVAFVRERRRLLIALLLLEAVALVVAIGLVAVDHGTWVSAYSCASGLPADAPAPNIKPVLVIDLEWLFAGWCVPLDILLLRALGAWERVEPPTRRYRLPRGSETGA